MAPPQQEEALQAAPSRPGSATAVYKLLAHMMRARALQVRRIQAMAAQAAEHERQAAAQQLQAERQARQARELEQLKHKQVAANRERAARAEAARKQKLAAAAQAAEQRRAELARKLEAGEQRAAVVQEQAAAVACLTQARHEQRREAARREAQARAEQEEEERRAWYTERQARKEAELQQRRAELGELHGLRRRQQQMRADYARHRMQLKEEREAERLGALTSKLAAKQARVAAMEAEKAAMLRALGAVNKELRLQEGRLRERLRETEGRDGVSAGELADLQRQLEELMEQPLPLPAGSRPSSAGAHWSSRPTSRQSSGRAAAAPLAKAAAAAHQLPSSPRIRAVQVALEEAASGSGAGSCAGLSARGEPAAPCVEAQAPPAASGGHHQAQQHEDLLQQMARVEMQREAERAAQLAACGSDGDRRRLATLYELERQQAMHLMQRLSV